MLNDLGTVVVLIDVLPSIAKGVTSLPFFTIMNSSNDRNLYAKLATCFHKKIGRCVGTDDIVLAGCILLVMQGVVSIHLSRILATLEPYEAHLR